MKTPRIASARRSLGCLLAWLPALASAQADMGIIPRDAAAACDHVAASSDAGAAGRVDARAGGAKLAQAGVGGAARLVVVDRDASWTVRRDTLVGRSANTPLLGRSLRGAVQLTMLHGSVAWQAGTTS